MPNLEWKKIHSFTSLWPGPEYEGDSHVAMPMFVTNEFGYPVPRSYVSPGYPSVPSLPSSNLLTVYRWDQIKVGMLEFARLASVQPIYRGSRLQLSR